MFNQAACQSNSIRYLQSVSPAIRYLASVRRLFQSHKVLEIFICRLSYRCCPYIMDQDITLLPSEDNVSLGIDEIDGFMTSNVSDVSRLSQTSHACTFDIEFNTLRYRD